MLSTGFVAFGLFPADEALLINPDTDETDVSVVVSGLGGNKFTGIASGNK